MSATLFTPIYLAMLLVITKCIVDRIAVGNWDSEIFGQVEEGVSVSKIDFPACRNSLKNNLLINEIFNSGQ